MWDSALRLPLSFSRPLRKPDTAVLITDEPMKFWRVFSCLIVYDPDTRPIGIARVLHGSRDLKAMFRNRPPRP